MTQTKFTPAPWEVKQGKDYKENLTVYSSGDNNYHIAYITTDGDSNYYIDDYIQRANAALIACAPEMYEMLEELLYGQVAPEDIEQLLKKARGE
jgi:hypothetical protein